MKFLSFSFQILIITSLINCAESPEQYKEAEISDYTVSETPVMPSFDFEPTNLRGGADHILNPIQHTSYTRNVVVDYSRKQGLHLDTPLDQIASKLFTPGPAYVHFVLGEKRSIFNAGVIVSQDMKTDQINKIVFVKPFEGALSLQLRKLELRVGQAVNKLTDFKSSPKSLTQYIYKLLNNPGAEKKDCFKEGLCSVDPDLETGMFSLELPGLTINVLEGLVHSFVLHRKGHLKSEINYLDLGEYLVKTKDHSFKLNKKLDEKTRNFLKSKSSRKDFGHLSKFRFIDSKKNYGRFFLNFDEAVERISFFEIPSVKIYGKDVYFKKPYLRIDEKESSFDNIFSFRKSDDSYVLLRQDHLKQVYSQAQDRKFHLEFSKQLANLVTQEWIKNEKTDKKFLHHFTDDNINFDETNKDYVNQLFYYQKLLYNEKTKLIKEFRLEWDMVPILNSWDKPNEVKLQNHLRIDIKSFKDDLLGAFLSQKSYANFVYNGSLPFQLNSSLKKTFKGAFEEIKQGTGISANKIHMPIQIMGPVFFTPLYFNSVKLPTGTTVIFDIKERISHEEGLGEVYLENKKSKANIYLKNSLNLTLPDLRRSTLLSFNPDNLIFNSENPLAYKEEKVQVLSATNSYLGIHIKPNLHSPTHETDENKFSGNLLAVDYRAYNIPKINVCFSDVQLEQKISKKDFMKRIQKKETEISSLVKSFETQANLPVYLIQNYLSAFHISYFFYNKQTLFKKLAERVQQKTGSYRQFKLENLKGETDYIEYQTIYLSLIGSNMKNEAKRKSFQDELFYLNSSRFKNKFLNYYALDKKDLNEISKDFQEVPVYLINALATYIKTQKQIEQSSELYFFAKANFKNKKRILKDIINFYSCQYSVKEDAHAYTVTFPYQGLHINFDKRSGLDALRVFNPFYLDEKE